MHTNIAARMGTESLIDLMFAAEAVMDEPDLNEHEYHKVRRTRDEARNELLWGRGLSETEIRAEREATA